MIRIRRQYTHAFYLCLLAALLSGPLPGVRAEPEPGGVEPHATLQGRTVQLKPSGATFQIPEEWLKWHAKFKNNLHLTRDQLKKVKDGEGEWDKEYADVVNAVLPFAKCAAPVGAEGWGREAVSFDDLQMRAYMVGMTPKEVQEKLSKEGVKQASKYSKNASAALTRDGDWHRATVTYTLRYGDYGGTASVDMYAQAFGKQTVVLVFMTLERKNKEATREILRSFTWKTAK